MFRQARLKNEPEAVEDGFKVRGENVSRVEAFADAVFGFALTLLVVTMATPENGDDLLQLIRGLPVFAVCFAMLYYLWNCHYIYCRRYSLEDATVRTITGLMLFTVLFFVYPLKFIFRLFINGFLGLDRESLKLKSENDIVIAFVVYGAGWFAAHLFFVLLYEHAYKQRDKLDLSPVERFRTRAASTGFLLAGSVGLLSIFMALALPWQLKSFAGFIYALIGPVAGFHGGWEGKRAKQIAAMESAASRQSLEEG